jgi:crotonyl-CoA carboxylase/reductase
MAEPLPIDATEFANETPVVFDVDAGMPLRAVRLKSDARTIRRERHGEP